MSGRHFCVVGSFIDSKNIPCFQIKPCVLYFKRLFLNKKVGVMLVLSFEFKEDSSRINIFGKNKWTGLEWNCKDVVPNDHEVIGNGLYWIVYELMRSIGDEWYTDETMYTKGYDDWTVVIECLSLTVPSDKPWWSKPSNGVFSLEVTDRDLGVIGCKEFRAPCKAEHVALNSGRAIAEIYWRYVAKHEAR